MKVCIVCHVGKPEVPDRNQLGRPIKRICRKCHADRLLRDLDRIVEIERKKNDKQTS